MNHVDELISASLSGDLTDGEREQMNAHLERCERCRDTLSAFADQRRLISGMRHVPVPRDLAPRIRTGIETGRRPGVAWWRRPGGIIGIAASITTAAVAVLLAVLIFRPNPNVSVLTSPTSTTSQAPTVIATESVAPTPTPTAPPSVEPTPSAVPDGSTPAGYFRYVVKNGDVTFTFVRGDDAMPIRLPSYGMPVDASLSPDGSMLALRVDGDFSGLTSYYVINLGDGSLTNLGESVMPAYGLGTELAWSPDSRYLAYTLTDPNTSRARPAIYSASGEIMKNINGEAEDSWYAGGWMPNDGTRSRLWISRAAETPSSSLVQVDAGAGGSITIIGTAATVEGVFQPLPAPDGKHVIFWRGTMGTPGGHWSFSEGGMPWLADVAADGSTAFDGARQIFSTLAGGREMFRGASIAWGPDSDAFAVWNAQWTGVPQGNRFPDSTDVYFGHISTPELITPAQTLDAPDTEGATEIVDVALAADGNHLGLTVLIDAGAEGGAFGPNAELRLVTRGYGTDPDQLTIYGQTDAPAGQPPEWDGPAVYPNVSQP